MNNQPSIASNKMAERDTCYMFYIKSQPWLPHYTQSQVYVAPCGSEKTESELLSMGAVKKFVHIWPRKWQKA